MPQTKYRPGDQLDFRLTVNEIRPDGRVSLNFPGQDPPFILWDSSKQIQPVNTIPAPLKLGDQVTLKLSTEHGVGTIRAVKDDYAWVEFAGPTFGTYHTQDLERA